jgi:hypothetical protein
MFLLMYSFFCLLATVFSFLYLACFRQMRFSIDLAQNLYIFYWLQEIFLENVSIPLHYGKGFCSRMTPNQKIASVLLAILMNFVFISGLNSAEHCLNFLGEKRFLLVIDFGFLNCSLCVQSLTEFIQVVNACNLEDSVLGVLVLHKYSSEPDSDKRVRIAEKRLKGFIIGHDIRFPVILDRQGIFRLINPEASATLLVFDTQQQVIKKYTFPLTRAQLDEILEP